MHPEFAVHGRGFTAYNGPLFKSPELNNYQLFGAFAESKTAAVPLPTDVRNLLGLSESITPYTGAYSSQPKN